MGLLPDIVILSVAKNLRDPSVASLSQDDNFLLPRGRLSCLLPCGRLTTESFFVGVIR